MFFFGCFALLCLALAALAALACFGLLGLLWLLALSVPLLLRFKSSLGARDQILPITINWPTNYNFALFSKLPTNYTKISEKIHFTYQNAPLRGAFT